MRTTSSSRPLARHGIAAAIALVSVCAVLESSVIGCGGAKPASEQTDTQNAAPVATPAPAETTATAAAAPVGEGTLEEGAKIYAQRCVLCHGTSGKGDGPGGKALKPPPRDHTDGAYMRSRTDEQLLEVLRNGKGQMPAWGKSGALTETQMRSVLKYVRTLAK